MAKVIGVEVQDAFHYALAAAGGSVEGMDSAFNVKRFRGDTGESRSHYMRLAVRKAREAGLVECFEVAHRKVDDAYVFAIAINLEAQDAGIDANTGSPPRDRDGKPLEGDALDAWKKRDYLAERYRQATKAVSR